MYFKHNDKMGHWASGLIVSIAWILVAILWVAGSIFIMLEDKDMNKRIKQENKNEY